MKHFKILLIFFVLLILNPIDINAAEKIKIHLFYLETCPHCKEEIKHLTELAKTNKSFELIKYEVSTKENSEKHDLVREAFGVKESGVPFTVIGTVYYIGYNTNVGKKLETAIDYYSENKYRDITTEVLNGDFLIGLNKFEQDIIKEKAITVPILGEINPKNISLPFIAAVIGTVDGFNPCAMWVLLFLISMLIGMKDKKRMWVLGLTFLLTSAFIYMLLMVSWLQISLSMIQIGYVRILIALFAIGAGGWNLNKYLKSRKSDVGCEVVSKEKRTKTFARVKKIVGEKNLIMAMLGVSLLAVSVNVVELACSAGLPLIFTQILAVNNLGPIEYSANILIYILFFLIDDIIIFAIAMKTFETVGMSNNYSKYSTLVGGLIMIIIGLLLIFAPNILMFA